MQRINVTGTSCSGKTTLARALADRLELPHVELDALFWGAGWEPRPPEQFRADLKAALSAEAWVADGGYQAARDITWRRVDTVVWLDYPLRTVLARWAARTVRRLRTGEELWPGTGNRETLARAIGRESLLWWILRTHRGRRRRTAARLAERPEIRVVRLRSPGAARRWLAGVSRLR